MLAQAVDEAGNTVLRVLNREGEIVEINVDRVGNILIRVIGNLGTGDGDIVTGNLDQATNLNVSSNYNVYH